MNCIDQASGDNWTLYHGDCCEVIKGIPDSSIDFCIHSPPFSNIYVYSDSDSDMGNCRDNVEFINHYSYLIGELLRVTVPGRLCAVHCKDLPLYKNRDGNAGLIDFPGMIIQEFGLHGWVYHSRVTIWKCPVTERERTNNHGLLHKTIKADSSGVRQGMADFLLVFRKPTSDGSLKSDKPVERPQGISRYIGETRFDPRNSDYHPSPFARTGFMEDESVAVWRRYAEPVWWDVDQTDVLNFKIARGSKDEKHICPLQMGLIMRAIDLWTLPGDVVLTPFGGVGSEVVGAIRTGRKGIGIELKPEYFKVAQKFCRVAEKDANQPTLGLEIDLGDVDCGEAGGSFTAGVEAEIDGLDELAGLEV